MGSSLPLGLIGCVDHIGIWCVVDFVTPVIDHNATSSFTKSDAVSRGTKVKNLGDVSCCY